MTEPTQLASDTRFRRIKCWLLACDGSPYCERCGTDLYDPDYIQYGKLDWLFRLYWNIRQRLTERKRCRREFGCMLPRGHEGDCDDIPF